MGEPSSPTGSFDVRSPDGSSNGVTRPTILIVGGGFSGTCAAIHLLRQRERPVEVVLIDPAQHPAGGLAHSSLDPDHRLNAPAFVHVVMPDDPEHLEKWLRANGYVERDKDSVYEGALYPRRSDFGAYMRAQLEQATQGSPSGFKHLQDRA